MKIFERLVNNQLYSYLNKTWTFFFDQSGFRPHHSTLTTLIILAEVSGHILEEIDAGRLVGGIFITLKKAFDTASYAFLLNKLCLFGVRGLELETKCTPTR